MKSSIYQLTKFYWEKTLYAFSLACASACLSVVGINSQLYQSDVTRALDNAVNNSGVIEAKSAVMENGEVILSTKPAKINTPEEK